MRVKIKLNGQRAERDGAKPYSHMTPKLSSERTNFGAPTCTASTSIDAFNYATIYAIYSRIRNNSLSNGKIGKAKLFD